VSSQDNLPSPHPNGDRWNYQLDDAARVASADAAAQRRTVEAPQEDKLDPTAHSAEHENSKADINAPPTDDDQGMLACADQDAGVASFVSRTRLISLGHGRRCAPHAAMHDRSQPPATEPALRPSARRQQPPVQVRAHAAAHPGMQPPMFLTAARRVNRATPLGGGSRTSRARWARHA